MLNNFFSKLAHKYAIGSTEHDSLLTGTFDQDEFLMSEQNLKDTVRARILCSQLDESLLQVSSRRNSLELKNDNSNGATLLLLDEAANGLADADAQFSLGCRYHSRGEYTTALRFYKLAALKLHSGAMNNIGVLVEQGKGTFADESFAFKWFSLGMDLGNMRSKLNYATLRALPKNAAHMDRSEAFEVLCSLREVLEGMGSELIHQGRNRMMLRTVYNNLGCMYCRGMGTAQDMSSALQMFSLAANLDSAVAKYNTGTMYLNGLGVNKDEAIANGWFEQATADPEHIDIPVIESATDSTKLLMVTTLLFN
eukprot:TRINITY_DN1038_c0_g1_i1.p1 TRINITY_DN1038_c0_g1~~TRINITY_DN1038_c0_g1_i1.p1  ORF type:complete len:310 (+),score=97.91 TRINITY_DN1038_c0_g1_i1:172-1101(+)